MRVYANSSGLQVGSGRKWGSMTKKLVLGFSTIIILLHVLIISYISYIDFIDLQIITSNSLISDKSVTVLFKDDDLPTLRELVNSYPNITVLSELYYDPDLRVWGICGNHHLDSKIDLLIKGTFFKKDDFFRKEFKAVVGKNVLNSDYCIEGNNGKKYFRFNHNDYEVIGSITSNISNMLDNTAFVNLDSVNSKFHKYIIDSSNSQRIVTAINHIKKEFDVDIVRENNNNFIERYIYNDADIHILNILVIIFISMLMVTLSMFTLRYYDEEVKAKRIIGISFKRIFFDLFKDIIFLMTINIAFVSTLYTIIYYAFLESIPLGLCFMPLIIASLSILITLGLIIYLYMLISNHLFYKNGVK